MHYNEIERKCEAIPGKNNKIARNCFVSTWNCIQTQMSKVPCERGIKRVETGERRLQETIDGLQPIPRDSANKGMAAMLVEQTKEILEKSFVYVHHHGGEDVM